MQQLAILAAQLGVEPIELIGYFAERAIWEVTGPLFLATGALVCYLFCKHCSKKITAASEENKEDAKIGYGILGTISLAVLVTCFAFLFWVTYLTILAVAAPEAYALEQILELLHGDD